ncbi:uncharacterized protein [Rutidosis leptorrhynchoides]|uniref:uncharacterized protein n=1 Tax=Rutidosis leptorrhynchoides TaxID=125765 RepID=UPI003A99CD3E
MRSGAFGLISALAIFFATFDQDLANFTPSQAFSPQILISISNRLHSHRKLSEVREILQDKTCIIRAISVTVEAVKLGLITIMDPQVFQNPLFLHLSDGPGSLPIQEKLIEAQNYRSWRQSVESALSTKRKLGFVIGTIARPANDPTRAYQWDTCNNIVISWLMNSISESIVKFIMFIGIASEIWT